jgi:hypothetical protein
MKDKWICVHPFEFIPHPSFSGDGRDEGGGRGPVEACWPHGSRQVCRHSLERPSSFRMHVVRHPR